jgi:hypothetical protein
VSQRGCGPPQDAWQRRAAVVILGEAGIGKTRLAADFASAHGALRTVKAHECERTLPYAYLERCLRSTVADPASLDAGVHQTLARIVAEWKPAQPEVEDGPLEPFRLRAAVTEVWPATLPCLVLDDLQWADDTSLEALQARVAHAGPARPQLSDPAAWAERDRVDAEHAGDERLIDLLSRRFAQCPRAYRRSCRQRRWPVGWRRRRWLPTCWSANRATCCGTGRRCRPGNGCPTPA